jgi:hypothetical protein
MVFLMETRMSEERAGDLMKSLGFPNREVVVAAGLSGGLALFWRRDVTVSSQSKSRSHIDVVLSYDKLDVRRWRFTGFYGEPRRELRKNSWYLLWFLRVQMDLPWLCAGDFNEVLAADEHFGACVREAWQMEGVPGCGSGLWPAGSRLIRLTVHLGQPTRRGTKCEGSLVSSIRGSQVPGQDGGNYCKGPTDYVFRSCWSVDRGQENTTG